MSAEPKVVVDLAADAPVETMPAAFVEGVRRVEALAPSQSDINDAIPDEFAEEAVGVRGEKRVDYKGVRLKNASGDLTKAAKNIIDMHMPRARVGMELKQKLDAGDLRDRPQHTEDIERKHPIDDDLARRCAMANDLRPVPRGATTFRGRHVRDEAGVRNLWIDARDPLAERLVRIALVGTAASQRVEIYAV